VVLSGKEIYQIRCAARP